MMPSRHWYTLVTKILIKCEKNVDYFGFVSVVM